MSLSPLSRDSTFRPSPPRKEDREGWGLFFLLAFCLHVFLVIQ